MDFIITLATLIPDWLESILAILVVLNALAALTPTPKDDEIIGKLLSRVRKGIDILAFNWGHSKNGK